MLTLTNGVSKLIICRVFKTPCNSFYSNMNKKLNLLLKRLKVFAGFKSKAKSAQFLLLIFNDSKFFELSKKNQKLIIENLLLYFDTLILGIENAKKQNKHFTFADIQLHLQNKIKDLCNYPIPKF